VVRHSVDVLADPRDTHVSRATAFPRRLSSGRYSHPGRLGILIRHEYGFERRRMYRMGGVAAHTARYGSSFNKIQR